MKNKALIICLFIALTAGQATFAQSLLDDGDMYEDTTAGAPQTAEKEIPCAATPDQRFENINAFNNYLNRLSEQYDIDWSLAGAVSECQPEMVKNALLSGANPKTTVSYVYETGNGTNNYRWLYINNEEIPDPTLEDTQFLPYKTEDKCTKSTLPNASPSYDATETVSLTDVVNEYCTDTKDEILNILSLHTKPYFASESAYNDWFWNLGTRAEKNWALQEAVELGDPRFVKIALDNGADVSDDGELATSLLFGAAIDDNTEVMVLLKNAGAKIDYNSNAAGEALIYAANTGKKNWVKQLVKGGVDIDYQDASGNTAADVALNAEIRSLLR